MQQNLAETVMNALELGVCTFAYLTVSGKPRVAIGTLNPNLIPVVSHKDYKKLMTSVVMHTAAADHQLNNFFEMEQDATFVEMAKAELESVSNILDQAAEFKESKKDEDWVNYFDFEKGQFRKFRKTALTHVFPKPEL